MAAYPTCVRCLSADSEVDVLGVCTTCKSRGSKETPAGPAVGVPIRPSITPPDPNVTKTEPKVDVATRTGPGPDGSTLATPVPAPPPTPPKDFSHYDRLEYLDRGGMGVIYVARDTRTERTVALKLMSGVALNDSRLRARFLTEGKALARLSHPGVVQVYEVDEWEGTPFIAMEYVPGGSLARRLRTGERPTPVGAAGLMAEVASAVAAAHDKKILHRDIKPGNILLTDAGRAKLADFGLASLIDETTRMTNPGGVLGTPAYMPPEQAAGKFGEVGPRSDVYSLGATLYDVLTGKPPFTGENAFQVIERVCRDDVVPPRKLNPAVPPDLERVVLRCLEKRQADRYESAAALANDLSRVARGEPIGKVSVIWYVKRFARRNGKVMGAVLGVLILVVLIAYTRPPRPVDAGPPAPPPDPLAVQEDSLVKKQVTEVIPERGLPPYFRRLFGDGNLAERNHEGGDHASFLVSHETTCVEICADTMCDTFRIEGEFQHLSTQHVMGRVGVYLVSGKSLDVIRWSAFEFSDFFVAPERVPKKDRIAGLQIVNRASILNPAFVTVGRNSQILKFEIEPFNIPNLNPWRRLRIVASPEQIRVEWWDEKSKTFIHVLTQTREQFVAGDRDFEDRMAMNPKHKGRVVPKWQPRGAFGVFAERGTVAYKNFKITPQ